MSMSGPGEDPAPAPGPEEPVQQEWDLFGEGPEEELEDPDPEGWGGPRQDRAQHLGLLADTWADAMPEGLSDREAPEDPDDVQDMLQYYLPRNMDRPEFDSRVDTIWALNDREDEAWMELQASQHIRQRAMGNWRNVLEDDLNCNHESIDKFRELLAWGPEGTWRPLGSCTTSSRASSGLLA